jgi:Ca2+-binding RTX toxin-like protein
VPTYTGTLGIDTFSAPTDEDWTIIGKGGNDVLSGAGGNDAIDGGSGNDTLSGGAGNDTFLIGAGAGIDSFNGGDGYDTILATADNATIQWSSISGIEEINGGSFSNVRIIFPSTDNLFDFTNYKLTNITIVGGDGNDIITGSVGDDTIFGGNGKDMLYGGDGNDVLDGGGGGPDLLDGGNGDDLLIANNGVKNYFGGAGYDTIEPNKDDAVMTVTTGTLKNIEQIDSGGWSNFQIVGLANVNNFMDFRSVAMFDYDIASISGANANDTIWGSAAADTIFGLDGNDTLNGGLGDDYLDGGKGIDTLNGGGGSDALFGGDGNDSLFGNGGDDFLSGDAGDDILHGGSGFNTLDGGDGNDTIYVEGIDSVFGGAGNDTIIMKGATPATAIDGGADYDAVRAGADNTVFHFASLANVEEVSANGFSGVKIAGTTTDDVMTYNGIALTGISEIDGLGGNDTITGSAGANVIRGGNGTDTTTGNGGADVFLGTKGEMTGDTITDFVADDQIHLLNFSAATATVSYSNGDLVIDPDGAGVAKAFVIHLAGDYSADTFHIVSDGGTGADIFFTI